MKTAIIKTDFWKEDKIFKLLPDVRLFYMCLLTNPERNTTRAFMCSDRLLAAYTGYNTDTIQMCKASLEEAGFIKIIQGYYVLSEQQCIEPKRGNLTKKIETEFLASLPVEVQKELIKSTSATLDYNNINNNKHNNNDIITTPRNVEPKYSDKDVEIVKRLFATVAQTFPTYKKLVNRVPKDGDFEEMNKLHRIDENEYKLIEDVLTWLFKAYQPSDTFDWKDQIKSVGNLRKHFDKLRAQYEKDKKSRRYVPNQYSSTPPGERKPVPVPVKEREIKVTPEEAEKNRIILDLVRAKKASFSDMKVLKSKSIDELKQMLKPV